MNGYTLRLDEIDRTHVALAGGKGAHLGELARIEGIRVPPGFCVTTAAFQRMLADASIDERLERLARLEADDREGIRAQSAEVRTILEGIPIPDPSPPRRRSNHDGWAQWLIGWYAQHE